jgi:hypothetical protein
LAWIHRRGVLYANAILPDGTRAFIPATWTNVSVQIQKRPLLGLTLASLPELLHACTVTAPLLARIENAISAKLSTEVTPHATAATTELCAANDAQQATTCSEYLAIDPDQPPKRSNRSPRQVTRKNKTRSRR